MTMRAATFERNDAGLIPEPASEDRLLDIDAAAFRDYFHRRPFVIGHRLIDHPLLQLPRLLELARALPAAHVEYNAGNIPISVDPNGRRKPAYRPEETIRRIEECQSWMALKYVEHDPAYRDLLHECLGEVKGIPSNSRRA